MMYSTTNVACYHRSSHLPDTSESRDISATLVVETIDFSKKRVTRSHAARILDSHVPLVERKARQNAREAIRKNTEQVVSFI